jgi:hypothetical protein
MKLAALALTAGFLAGLVLGWFRTGPEHLNPQEGRTQ